jgi:hypothetical protein
MILDENIKLTFIIFVAICFILYYFKPHYFFHKNGDFKAFGLSKDKTIFPFWLTTLFIGFMVYYIILLKDKDYL